MNNLITWLFIYLNFMLELEACNLTSNIFATSSYERSQTSECKELIKKKACELEEQNLNYLNLNDLNIKNGIYKLNLQSKCPKSFRIEKSKDFFQGCTNINDLENYLKELEIVKDLNSKKDDKIKIFQFFKYEKIRALETCVKICLTNNHFKYVSFNKKTLECICLKNLTDTFRLNLISNQNECSDKTLIYHTGLLDARHFNETFESRPYEIVLKEFNFLKNQNALPRIVFLLTLNGRSVRQIFRLIKTIYNDLHFYYFHIDQRMNYLKTEIEKFIKHTKRSNFYISKWSYSTIWGGSSLLEMHLKSLKEIISKKDKNEWNWDYVINLSETDFPIKSIQELTLYLSKQGEKNFLKFYKSSYEKFSQNQGFEIAFLECENRMWRLGNKKYPIGIQFSGGSDWFCLNSKFVNYLIKSKENYIEELKKFFNFSLLPSEAFFHTVLQNSPFCDDSYKNTHLRFVNWKRSRGCNCQHKKIVDWCGCSPNYLTYKHDLEILKDFKNQPVFFSRKFDPLNNQLMINIMDQSIFGLYQTEFKSLNSYWENVYDQADKLENEFVKLFMFFSKISEEKLKERVYALGDEISLDQSLRKVNAFFEADTFKGYVLNLKTEKSSLNIEYESYFTVKNLKNNIKIFELSDKQNQSLVFMRENFLQSLIIARVSSDFDHKERKFSNYANVMSVNSNPILQMEFDPISEPIEFIIAWFDPNDIELKRTQVKFNTSEKNQLMLHSLQKMDNFTQLNKSGLWKIEIYLQGIENNLILSIRFLVMPKENFQNLDLSIWIPIIENFWQFNSICFFKTENLKNKNSILFDNLFKSCKKESFWSSHYPDPKSDIYENLEIDLIHRIV